MAYNTTPFHGKLARVEKNAVNMDFTDGWTITSNLDLADISRQGQQWKEGVPGQGSWSGSFSGQFVPGDAVQIAIFGNLITATPGTKLTDVKFIGDAATNGFSGDLYITSVAVSAAVGDKCSFTANFVGDGALSISDAQ